MALRATDLPAPVVPATSRCGILARSATAGWPLMSLPSARVSGALASANSLALRFSDSRTISRCSLGISSPTVVLPGITSTTRTLMADRERARSLARLVIWLTLTPAAGCSS